MTFTIINRLIFVIVMGTTKVPLRIKLSREIFNDQQTADLLLLYIAIAIVET